jgi:hypothetical protein
LLKDVSDQYNRRFFWGGIGVIWLLYAFEVIRPGATQRPFSIALNKKYGAGIYY